MVTVSVSTEPGGHTLVLDCYAVDVVYSLSAASDDCSVACCDI